MPDTDAAPPHVEARSLEDMLAEMRGLSTGASLGTALPRRAFAEGAQGPAGPAGDEALKITAELLDEALEQRLRTINGTIEEGLRAGNEALRRELASALAGLADEVIAGSRVAMQDDAALAERTVAAVQRRLDAATRQLDELLERVERREARLPTTAGAGGRGAATLLLCLIAAILGLVGGVVAAPHVEPYLTLLFPGR